MLKIQITLYLANYKWLILLVVKDRLLLEIKLIKNQSISINHFLLYV